MISCLQLGFHMTSAVVTLTFSLTNSNSMSIRKEENMLKIYILKSEKKRYFAPDTPLQFRGTVLVDKRRRKSGASGKNKDWRGVEQQEFYCPSTLKCPISF